MKKWIGIALVILLTASFAFGQDVVKPRSNNFGSVGDATHYYARGYFTGLSIRGITYTWPAADGTAGQQLTTNASGVLSWAAAGGSSTAWDDIGIPDAEKTLAFAGFKQTISSTLNAAGSVLTFTNTTADLGADVSFIDFKYTDDGDTNGYFLRGYDNAGGDLKWSIGYDGSASFGAITGTQITVSSTVLDANSLDFVGVGAITTGASTALTLNVAGGDAAGEDLIVVANNFTLSAAGAIAIPADAALAVAIDLSDPDIVAALSLGANSILGTNFSVTEAGAITCASVTASGAISGATILQDAIAAKSVNTTLTLDGTGNGGVSIGTVSGTGTITLGGGGKATLVNLPSTVDLTLVGGQLSVTDTADADLVKLINNTLTTTEILDISATGTRTSGNVIKITDGASTASTISIVASTQTSGKGISYTNAGAGILTGDAIYLAVTDGAGFSGSYLNCFDGAASDFTIKRYGATVIAGNASGTDALTLTNGDILVTAGNIDITTGNFAIGTGFIALGTDPADAGAIRLSNATYIESEKAVTGTDISIIGVDASDIIQIGASGSSGAVITPATTITGVLTLSANPRIYDGDSNYVTLDAPNIAGDITVILPSTAGTLMLTVGSPAAMVIASQAAGDILMASSGTAWTSLVDVAAGQPLLSGGIGAVPAYAGYTFSGTGAQTYTFPTTTATLARTDAGNTFTGHQTMEGVLATGATGTGKHVYDTSPTLATAVLTTPTLTKAVVDGKAAVVLSAAQVSDTVITNTGQIVGDVNHTLPAAAAGYSFVGLVGQTLAATNYWRFTASTIPTPDDYMCVNGTCGKLYASVDTPTMGDKITCHTAKIASTGIKTGGALAMGSTKDKVANGAFEFDSLGQGYAETADAVGTELNAITTPQNKYGAQALDIGADGTIDPISGTNIATGFDTPGDAVTDLPAAAAGHARIGYVTAMRTNVAGFVWGTTEFDDAETTEAFTSSTAYTPPYGWICTSDQGTWSTN